jgi:hypothetical protein
MTRGAADGLVASLGVPREWDVVDVRLEVVAEHRGDVRPYAQRFVRERGCFDVFDVAA